MGRGTDEGAGIIYVKLQNTKKGKTPSFVYKENKVETEGNYLSGYITGLSTSDYEWEGEKIDTFIIKMVDGSEKYQLEVSYTSMSRAILNYLSTVENPGLIKIKVVEADDKDSYPSVFVDLDEEHLKWRWKYEKLSELIDGEGKNADYSRLNNFWSDQIENTLDPLFKEAFARMSHHGNFAAPNQVPPVAAETKSEEIKDESVKAKDLDLSEQHPKQEDPAPTDLPVIEEKSDDLPF